MGKIIVLDTGVLGIVTNPKDTAETQASGEWLLGHLKQNALVFRNEIADYELRRELIRAKKARGLRRLDALISTLHYEPLTTAAMRHEHDELVVATTNPKHLSPFVTAKEWQDISGRKQQPKSLIANVGVPALWQGASGVPIGENAPTPPPRRA